MKLPIQSNPGLGERNVFEQLYELIERHRLNYENDFNLVDLDNIVSNLDNAFAELNSTIVNGINITLYNSILNSTIGIFLKIFLKRGFHPELIFFAFKRFLIFFTLIVKEADKLKSDNDLFSNFYDNFHALEFDSKKPHEISIVDSSDSTVSVIYTDEELITFIRQFPPQIGLEAEFGEEYEGPIEIYTNDNVQKTIEWSDITDSFITVKEVYYMHLEITVGAPKFRSEKLFQPIWLITTALSQIDNLDIELKNIQRGSIVTKLKILTKDLVAKEECKAVLQTGMEFATKALSAGAVSYTDIKKSRQETIKIRLENQRHEIEISQMPSASEVDYKRALELQSQVLDNEKKEIENANAKIDLITKLSDLVSKGILEADMIRINVDDVLRLFKSNDNVVEIGPDIAE